MKSIIKQLFSKIINIVSKFSKRKDIFIILECRSNFVPQEKQRLICGLVFPKTLLFPLSLILRQITVAHSYLIHEGSFGCRAGRHVGLIQVKSPMGEATVYMWIDERQNKVSSCKNIICVLFSMHQVNPALTVGYQEQWLPSGKSRPSAHYGTPPSDYQS